LEHVDEVAEESLDGVVLGWGGVVVVGGAVTQGIIIDGMSRLDFPASEYPYFCLRSTTAVDESVEPWFFIR